LYPRMFTPISRKWKVFILDFILQLIALLMVITINMGAIPPYNGSFRCDDPAIQFPYKGNTISTGVLMFIIFLPIIFLIFNTELFHSIGFGLFSALKYSASSTCSIFIRYWVSMLACVAVNLSLKLMLALPRPHFIHSCKPDWSLVNCSENGG